MAVVEKIWLVPFFRFARPTFEFNVTAVTAAAVYGSVQRYCKSTRNSTCRFRLSALTVITPLYVHRLPSNSLGGVVGSVKCVHGLRNRADLCC